MVRAWNSEEQSLIHLNSSRVLMCIAQSSSNCLPLFLDPWGKISDSVHGVGCIADFSMWLALQYKAFDCKLLRCTANWLCQRRRLCCFAFLQAITLQAFRRAQRCLVQLGVEPMAMPLLALERQLITLLDAQNADALISVRLRYVCYEMHSIM